jgi:predicted RNA-binding Zn ribbon-like protein
MPAMPRPATGRDPHIGQAPGELAKVQAFVNTLDIEQSTDELTTPAELARWLQRAGLIDGPDGSCGPRQLTRAVELREALRGVLRSHVTHEAVGAGSGPAARIAAVAAAMRIAIQPEADGRIRLEPADSGAAAGLTRLLLIAAEASTLGTWARLKVCSADDCQWAFYDRSPTRNGCWCSMQICGSRAKSRAYRKRAAAGSRLSATASRSARTAATGA